MSSVVLWETLTMRCFTPGWKPLFFVFSLFPVISCPLSNVKYDKLYVLHPIHSHSGLFLPAFRVKSSNVIKSFCCFSWFHVINVENVTNYYHFTASEKTMDGENSERQWASLATVSIQPLPRQHYSVMERYDRKRLLLFQLLISQKKRWNGVRFSSLIRFIFDYSSFPTWAWCQRKMTREQFGDILRNSCFSRWGVDVHFISSQVCTVDMKLPPGNQLAT